MNGAARANGGAAGPIAASISVDWEIGSKTTELIRRGNETIRAAIRTHGGQRVPFFCECAHSICEQAVWLSLEDYDRHSRTGEPFLFDGHVCCSTFSLLARETTRTKE